MEIITLSTKPQNSEVIDKWTTHCCFPGFFRCLLVLLQRMKYLFVWVVLFQTRSASLSWQKEFINGDPRRYTTNTRLWPCVSKNTSMLALMLDWLAVNLHCYNTVAAAAEYQSCEQNPRLLSICNRIVLTRAPASQGFGERCGKKHPCDSFTSSSANF